MTKNRDELILTAARDLVEAEDKLSRLQEEGEGEAAELQWHRVKAAHKVLGDLFVEPKRLDALIAEAAQKAFGDGPITDTGLALLDLRPLMAALDQLRGTEANKP